MAQAQSELTLGGSEMTEETFDKWVKALRSGDHEQGIGCLRFQDAYCCLGVLCNVMDPDGWQKSVGGEYSWRGWHFFFSTGIISGAQAQELAKMNDFYNKSFAEIADYLEEQKALYVQDAKKY